MKIALMGTLALIIVLAGLFLYTTPMQNHTVKSQISPDSAPVAAPANTPNDPFGSLKIN